MRIKGILMDACSAFDTIEIIDGNNNSYFIKWDDADFILNENNREFIVKDGYFLNEADEEYDSETRCLADVIKDIPDDYATGLFFKLLEFSDDEGTVEVTFDRDGGIPQLQVTCLWERSSQPEELEKHSQKKPVFTTIYPTFEEIDMLTTPPRLSKEWIRLSNEIKRDVTKEILTPKREDRPDDLER